jgi:hypothetical protein
MKLIFPEDHRWEYVDWVSTGFWPREGNDGQIDNQVAIPNQNANTPAKSLPGQLQFGSLFFLRKTKGDSNSSQFD